jgi:hypothetical protein
LSLNTTTIQSGQAINVTASIFNTLSTINNVTGANDWAIPSLPSASSFPCPTYLEYQVYQGWYSSEIISQSGLPLQVTPVFQFLSCIILRWSYYVFQAYSDTAYIPSVISALNSSTMYQDTQMRVSSSLTGNYSDVYNASIFTQNGALPPPPFRPGVYTIVAGDEWGQIVLQHFVVLPAINEKEVTSVSTLSKQFHNLIFNQTGTCSNPTSYVSPWAVTLDNKTTLSRPANVSVPVIANSWGRAPYNEPIITFSVPGGTYSYVIFPLNVFGESGIVTVNNSDVVVQVDYHGFGGCTAQHQGITTSHTDNASP